MKKIILLITILSIIIGLKIDVYAASYTDKMIVSDVIDGIYYAKEKNGNIEYRRAKFKRRTSDNSIVYCIEPFVDITESKEYKGYDSNYEKLLGLSKTDWERISLLAYYGYGYKNHTASKWYPITQLLIWETIDKKASFYYTDSFKGKKISKFEEEIEEIESLVSKHNVKPSFDNSSIEVSINDEIVIKDKNKVLDKFKIKNSNIDTSINDNSLIIKTNKEEKEYEIELIKEDNIYKNVPIIYVSDTYQNILSVGSYIPVNSKLKINVSSGNIKITKIDSDSKDTNPQGEAKLEGAIYELLDASNNSYGKIEIKDNSTGILEHIKYGEYILKEIEAGKGYKTDKQEHKITINENNKEIDLKLENEVIKNKFRIYKYYELDKNKKSVESNIIFEIFNSNNELVKEIKTNENGIIDFSLPYGNYTIKQKNTTDGYLKVDDIKINVKEDSDEVKEFYLNDLKIPDTNENELLSYILIILLLLLFIILSINIYEEINN